MNNVNSLLTSGEKAIKYVRTCMRMSNMEKLTNSLCCAKTSCKETNMQIVSQSWLKKLGWIGFLFFLVKGLIWLALGFAAFSFFD